jgi:hypothetical protein
MGPDLKLSKRNILAKEGKEWLILLLSLLLAFFAWVVHNLSSQYPVYLQYRIEAKSNLPGRVMKSISEDLIVIRANATGFYIIENRLFEEDPLLIEVDSEHLIPQGGSDDSFIVNIDDVKDELYAAIGNKVSVENITTNNVVFTFPKINSKKVPIVPKSSITYYEQYMMVGDIYFTPDSVTVYGEDEYLENINVVYSEIISIKSLKESTKGVQRLVVPKRVELSDDKIYYSIIVDRFVEESIIVPIQLIFPEAKGELIAIPSRVNVTYRQSFSYRKKYTEKDFSLVVSYSDFLNSIDSKVVPEMKKMPAEVYDIYIYPRFVECIFIEN